MFLVMMGWMLEFCDIVMFARAQSHLTLEFLIAANLVSAQSPMMLEYLITARAGRAQSQLTLEFLTMANISLINSWLKESCCGMKSSISGVPQRMLED